MTSAPEPIVAKIKKLLALADGNQNENEREVAMKFALELLAKHNLTMESLDLAEARNSVKEFEADITLEPWISDVLGAACELYYTEVFFRTKVIEYESIYGPASRTRKVPVFVGTPDNIAVTMQVATWLMQSIRSESNRRYRSAPDRRSFRVGAAFRLHQRAFELVYDERYGDKTKSNSKSNSLMVIRQTLERANQDYMATLNLTSTPRRATTVVSSAFNDGEAYGDKVVLNRNASTPQAKRLTAAR